MKSRNIKKTQWTKQQEDLLISWAEKASGYAWLHEKTVHYYKRNNMYIAIPSSIFGYIAGATTLLSDETFNVGWMRGFVGISAIIAGIAANFQHMFKYRELSEQHRITSLRFLSFFRDISCELSMNPKHRADPIDYITLKRMEFDKILEQSPQVPSNIIEQFNLRTENMIPKLHKPEVTNILQTIIPYKEFQQTSPVRIRTPSTVTTETAAATVAAAATATVDATVDATGITTGTGTTAKTKTTFRPYTEHYNSKRKISKVVMMNMEDINNSDNQNKIIIDQSSNHRIMINDEIHKMNSNIREKGSHNNNNNKNTKINVVSQPEPHPDPPPQHENRIIMRSDIQIRMIYYLLKRKYLKKWKRQVRKKLKLRHMLHKKNKGLNVEVANSYMGGSDTKSKTYLDETSSSSTRDDVLLYGLENSIIKNNTSLKSDGNRNQNQNQTRYQEYYNDYHKHNSPHLMPKKHLQQQNINKAHTNNSRENIYGKSSNHINNANLFNLNLDHIPPKNIIIAKHSIINTTLSPDDADDADDADAADAADNNNSSGVSSGESGVSGGESGVSDDDDDDASGVSSGESDEEDGENDNNNNNNNNINPYLSLDFRNSPLSMNKT
jgi:hypothetical protein